MSVTSPVIPDLHPVSDFRLHPEFATRSDHLPSARFSITDAELADYMEAHTPKNKPGASAHRGDQES